jgi:hypothetical protein
MRNIGFIFSALAVASAVWATIAGYRIGAWLSRHGVRVNWLLYRATMPWHVHQYRKMTKESDGRAGPLYSQFIVAIDLALVFAVISLVWFAIARR